MGFNPSGGKLQNATDVGLGANTPYPPSADGQFLSYSVSNGLWQNTPLTGFAALPKGGGAETVSTLSTTSSTLTLDLVNGNVFNVTLTRNVTFTFTGATNGKACSFGAYLRQDGTGGRTVTWPASVKWAGGTKPTLTSSANAIDILVFETLDGGTTWFGSLVGANFS